MSDHTEVIKLLQDHIRTLDYMSKPTPNVVTEHFAKENIAKAVKIHAAIDALKAIGSQEPVAVVRPCRDEGVIINGNNDEISVNLPPGTRLFLASGAAPKEMRNVS